MIQIIPSSQNLKIVNNPNSVNQFSNAIIGFVVYTGNDVKHAPYEADDDIYVRPLTTLDCMEWVQAACGGDAYITLDEDNANF